jgi:hypothetical protein
MEGRAHDMTKEPAKEPASTWTYEQGVLVVHHQGKSISLGRYATHELAAKAAAAYFANHGGQQ